MCPSVSTWHRNLGAEADLILVSVPTMWVHMCGMSKCMPCTCVSYMLGVSGSCHGSPYSWALQNDSIGGQPWPSAHPLRILVALFSDVPCSESPFPNLGQNPSGGRAPGGDSDSKADILHVNRPTWVLTSSRPSLIMWGEGYQGRSVPSWFLCCAPARGWASFLCARRLWACLFLISLLPAGGQAPCRELPLILSQP